VFAYFFDITLTDPLYAAMRIPSTLRQLLAEGALSAAYVPTFTETLEKDGKEEADKLARSLFVILFAVVSLIVILGVIFAPLIVKIIMPGFEEEASKAALTIQLTRIMFPYLLFVSLAALLMGSLHSLGHFSTPALSPVMLNVCIILSVVVGSFFLAPGQLIYFAAFGFLAGGFVQMAIQFPPLIKRGVLMGLPQTLKHPKLPVIGKLLIPATFGQGITQINMLVSLYFATQLTTGSVSYLFYSMRLVQFPLGIFGIAVATASFPTFSRLVLLEDSRPLLESIRRGLRMNLFLIIPSTLGLIALGPSIIGLLFDHGAFHQDGSLMPTYYALCFYMVGMLAYASLKLVVSIYYAFKDMKTPIKVGAVAVVINIVLAFFLIKVLDYKGLPLATALASLVNVGSLLVLVSRKLGKGWWHGLPLFGAKALSAAVPMALAVWYVVGLMPELPYRKAAYGLEVAVGLTVGGLVYLGLSWLMMRTESEDLLKRVRDAIASRRNVPTD